MALKFNQIKKKKNQAPQPPVSRSVSTTDNNVKKSTTKTSIASETTNASPTTSTASEKEIPNVKYAPEWVASAQEEIHTLIAQRHFGEALALITKCEEYFSKDSSFHNATEIIQKVFQLYSAG